MVTKYKPSISIKKRISNWEGRSMYAPAPDTGKVNRSFEAEARDFERVIPTNLFNQLSQDEKDALYSTSYNIGAGNFKKRVVPALTALYTGQGSVEDVQKSMYGTKDKRYRGLTLRRNTERSLFGEAYRRMHPEVKLDVQEVNPLSPTNIALNTMVDVYNQPEVLPEPINDTNLPEVKVVAKDLSSSKKRALAELEERERLNFFGNLYRRGDRPNVFDRILNSNPIYKRTRRYLDSF